MATENLKVKITADASQAKAEIGKFKDSLKGAVATGESVTKTFGKIAAGIAGLTAAIKVTKALIKNTVDVAAAGDAIKDNAQKVFMSTTAYQEWGYVLKQNGIEIGALKMGMRKFAQEVATGSDSLKKYGITATDVDTAFQQAIYTIQNMTSETEKIAAATELFGTRALELFPILNLTNAETQSLMETYRAIGGTMSNELIAASDICTDSITEMKMAWGGLRNLLATYFIPIVTKIVQWITLAIAKIRILLAALFGIKETFGGSTKRNSIAGASASTAKSTGGTAGNLKKAAKHAKELRRTLMGIDELSKLAEKATAASSGGSGGGGGGGGVSVGGVDAGDIADFEGLMSSEMLEKIDAFRQKVEKIAEPLNGVYLILKGLVELAFGKPVQGLSDIWEGLKKIIPPLQTVEDGFNKIVEWVKKKIEAVFSVKLPNFDDIKKKWADLKKKAGSFKTTATLSIKDGFTKTWNKIKKGWNSIKSKSATIKLAFVDSLKKGYNSIAEKIQRVRNKWPATKIILPDLHPLARGGVLTAPTPALLGEYPGARSNPEIATPQSLMYETIQKANGDMVSAFALMTRQVISAIENKDMTVTIGDEQVARSAQRGNIAYKNRTGKALI